MKPEYRAINPAGLVPAIQEDGLGVLGECSAILAYLAESRQLSQWYPSNAATRAKINFWMSWNHGNTRLCTSGILRNKLFPPKTGGDELIAAAQKTLKGSLTLLENQLKITKFLVAGDKPTIADLVLLTELDTSSSSGFGLVDFTPYPNVTRWMGDMAAELPTYAAVFEPVKVIAAALAAKAKKQIKYNCLLTKVRNNLIKNQSDLLRIPYFRLNVIVCLSRLSDSALHS